jgi:hypothetical protein
VSYGTPDFHFYNHHSEKNEFCYVTFFALLVFTKLKEITSMQERGRKSEDVDMGLNGV